MVYPALLTLIRTPRLPAVDWTDAPTGRFKWTRSISRERRNLVSARVTSHINWPLMADCFRNNTEGINSCLVGGIQSVLTLQSAVHIVTIGAETVNNDMWFVAGDELTPLEQRRSFRDASLITGHETVCPAVCVSSNLQCSLRASNTQTHSQPFSSGSNSKWTLKKVTTTSHEGNRGGVNSKEQQGQIFSFTYGGADKSLARPGTKQANVSVRVAFGI